MCIALSDDPHVLLLRVVAFTILFGVLTLLKVLMGSLKIDIGYND